MELCCLTQSRLDVSFKKVANPSEMLGSERTGFCFRKHGSQINSCSIHWTWSVYLYRSNSVFVNISRDPCRDGVTENENGSEDTESSRRADCVLLAWRSDHLCVPVWPRPNAPNKMSFHKQQPDVCVVCVKLCVCVCVWVSVCALLYSPETPKSPSGSQAILWAWWRNVGEKRRMIINGFMLRRQPST